MQAFWEWFVSPAAGIIATWVGGLGTTAAVIVALWQSGRETRKQRKDERMSQARNVAAWIASDTLVPSNGDTVKAGDQQEVVHIKNGSEVPIYTASVVLVSLKGTKAEHGEDVVYRSPEMASLAVFSVVPPGTYRTTFALPPWANKKEQRVGVEVAFKDSAGRSWVRRGNGELSFLGKKDPRKGRVFDGSGLQGDLYRVEDS